MNIGIFQTVNAHAPAIHWWLAHDPRFGPQLYEGTSPRPNKLAIGNIVQELRNDEQTQEINEELYDVHQESLREMENKRESLENGILRIDCTSEYFKFNKDFKYPVWSNYFGNCYSPEYAPLVDKLIFTHATTEQSAMFYITQYAFNTLSIVELTNHCKIWWEDHMLMGGDTIGKWKELWYRDYHDQCIADLESGKLQYMWQLNFAHWDLFNALNENSKFDLDYSFYRLFEEKHNPDDFHGQNDTLGYIKENNIDHLVVDVEWFKNTDVILDYLGVSNSQVLTDTAKLYGERYKTVVEAYDILYNKYYVKGEQV